MFNFLKIYQNIDMFLKFSVYEFYSRPAQIFRRGNLRKFRKKYLEIFLEISKTVLKLIQSFLNSLLMFFE